MGYKREPCTACASAPRHEAQHCHECKGLGYSERSTYLPGCTKQARGPDCPVEYEAMVGGWYCRHCKESGPC